MTIAAVGFRNFEPALTLGGMGRSQGGVFINYRSNDQPVAAAAIHDWLARRFGDDRVFRDCVSIRAGDHYPTVIREALERASVLVAVVGPRWLTLTDECSAVRLIDREHDWVRNEIAYALQWRIPIVPVLLKHTPADAAPPAPDDLPADIRAFATLQALEISHRRLGADLEHLAERLVYLAPTLLQPLQPLTTTNGDSDDPTDPFTELVRASLAVPCVRDERSRRLLLSRLSPDIATVVPHHANDRSHVIALLLTCLQYDGGLDALVGAIRTIDGDGPHVRHLADAVSAFLSTSMDRICPVQP